LSICNLLCSSYSNRLITLVLYCCVLQPQFLLWLCGGGWMGRDYLARFPTILPLTDTLREALRASDAGVSLLHVRYLMATVVGEGLICGRQSRDLNALPFCCTPLHCIGSRGLLEIDVLALCYCRVWRARPRPRPANQFFDVHKAMQASAAAAGSGYLLSQFPQCH